MSFQDTLVDVIDTNLTKKPNTPQLKFTNPLKTTLYINSIQLSFDSYFAEQGSVIILVNNNPVLNKQSGSLKRLQNLNVPMENNEFFQQQKIEIYAWNGSGGTDIVSLGYDIKISENPNASNSSDTPLSQIQRNSEISEPEILFEKKVYFEESLTALLFMKGYKKLIVNMSASTIPDLTMLSSIDDTSTCEKHDYGNYSNAPHTNSYGFIDAIVLFSEFSDFTAEKIIEMLAGSSSFTRPTGDEIILEAVIDAGDYSQYGVSFDFTTPTPLAGINQAVSRNGFANTGNSITSLQTKCFIQTEESDSEFGAYSVVDAYGAVELSGTKSFSFTKRYAKIKIKTVTYMQWEVKGNGNPPTSNDPASYNQPELSQLQDTSSLFLNLINQFTKGGTASLSFEELDIASNTFGELIPSTEFGTITEGQAVKEQIGDVNNVSLSGKTYFLPSTQTGFLAKLTVIDGGIETGVSIRRIQ